MVYVAVKLSESSPRGGNKHRNRTLLQDTSKTKTKTEYLGQYLLVRCAQIVKKGNLSYYFFFGLIDGLKVNQNSKDSRLKSYIILNKPKKFDRVKWFAEDGTARQSSM